MEKFAKLFKGRLPAIIGMIHVRALPGTPCHGAGMKYIINQACMEADTYKQFGIDAILLENMHDIPYLNRAVGPEIVASMAAVCSEVKRQVTGIPCGIQILAGCNNEAMAVAKACDLDFVRAEGFVFSHVADEGIMNADAAQLLRYRKFIQAENVLIFTDMKKKHSSHVITQDVNLVDTARAAEFFLSDGLVITGSHTGDPARPEQLKELKQQLKLPVIVGSGVTDTNLQDYIDADALIVGSHFKDGGLWSNEISPERISVFMEALRSVSR